MPARTAPILENVMSSPSDHPARESSLAFDLTLTAMMLVVGVLLWRFLGPAGAVARIGVALWFAGWIAFPLIRHTRAAPAETEGVLDSARSLWEAATDRHDAVLRAYLPYETDPLLVLEHPAISDVTQEPTQEFLEALGRAQALRTDALPMDAEFRADYDAAVRELEAAWERARRHAMRVGRDYLEGRDARLVTQAGKLLAQARDSTSALERAAYAARAHRLLGELTSRGAIVLPPRVIAAVAAQARRAIEGPDETA